MENEMNLKALKALSDPTRFHIVVFLSKMCNRTASLDETGGVEGPTAGEICCHITGAEKITSTISHHLHELEDAGLIRIERNGKRMICSLRAEALEILSNDLRSLAEGVQEGCC